MDKYYRDIECPDCGHWEQMNVDEQRWHSQTFEWIENIDEEAKYKCICGSLVKSIIKESDNISANE